LELRELTLMAAEGGVAPMEAARECVGDFGCAARGEEDMVVQNGKVDNLVLLNAQNFFWSSEDAATLPTHYGEAAAGVWAIFQKNPECPLDSASLYA
jgi:hypothetical protein